MNIFYLDKNLKKCAQYHVDRHVVKMILETAQLLSTACHYYGKPVEMKPTHKNHPCAVWARRTNSNWLWLQALGLCLCEEYTHRYDKTHRLESYINNLKNPAPRGSLTEMPQCMPDEFKRECAVEAYRNYYANGKRNLHSWKFRDKPEWIKEKGSA